MDFDSRAKTWDADPMKRARALAVAQAIIDQVPLTPRMSALEFGCGTGLLSFALRGRFGQITLADNSSGMLAVVNDKIQAAGIDNMAALEIDLVTDELPPERYDVVHSLMTMHHIADTDALLRSLYALLKSPGYLCLADLDSEDGSFHGTGFSGHHGFDRETLREQATSAGFCNIRFSTIFNIRKTGASGEKDFPVFLMIGEKH